MESVTTKIEKKLLNVNETLNLIVNQASSVYKLYWATSVSTDISGLSASDPATIDGGISKADLVNGLSIAEQLNNFFGNSAVASSDYLANINKILYTNIPRVTKLSNAVESLASLELALMWNLLNVYNEAKVIINLYFKNEVGDIVGVLDANRLIPGSNLTQADLAAGVTMLTNIVAFMENGAVTTSDYQATLSKLLVYGV